MRSSVSFLLLLALVAPLSAQNFGSAVAVGDGEVFVGEPLNEMSPGIVYVYRKGASGWTEAARLMASDAAAGDHFGRGVAVDGSTLLVGATVPNATTGAAYVFRKDPATGSWVESARLVADDGVPGDAFGRAVALEGDVALVATWAADGEKGAVYVFERGPLGSWSQRAKLQGSDLQGGDWFGMALDLEGDRVVVGVPQKNRGTGAAYVFRRSADGAWTQEAKLESGESEGPTRFGSAVGIANGRIHVGAPALDAATGALYTFAPDLASGAWGLESRVVAFDGSMRAQFGVAVAADGDEVWAGAPGADGFEGRAYVLRRGAGGWLGTTKLGAPEVDPGDALAATLAVRGGIAVAGIVNEDFGAGAAVVYERAGDDWGSPTRLISEIPGLDPVLGGQVDCREGSASLFDCSEVDLVSFLPVQALGGGRGVELNDVWGWTDPESGREYALVGRYDGTSFVDVTDPLNPRYLGQLPKTEGSRANVWRDIKVYRDHAYVVADGAGQHGMQVFDLTRLRGVAGEPVTFTQDAHYDRIASAHNIVINEETGFAYAVGSSGGGETCGGGLHMIDIRDPLNPTFAGCFADAATGRQKTGYSHDAQCVTYRGPDTEHEGREICFGSNETALSIADVTDKTSPVALAMASYPNVGYSHQGWLTEDHRYFFMDDELDEIGGQVQGTRTLIWDVADLDDPVLVKEYISQNRASDHNLYIKGDLVYQSNYVSGLRILNISDVENPIQVGYFDTVPYGEDEPGFNGSWSNYPFFASGNLVVTSGKEGLFVLRKKERVLLP